MVCLLDGNVDSEILWEMVKLCTQYSLSRKKSIENEFRFLYIFSCCSMYHHYKQNFAAGKASGSS